jgi:hypothetical protein
VLAHPLVARPRAPDVAPRGVQEVMPCKPLYGLLHCAGPGAYRLSEVVEIGALPGMRGSQYRSLYVREIRRSHRVERGRIQGG